MRRHACEELHAVSWERLQLLPVPLLLPAGHLLQTSLRYGHWEEQGYKSVYWELGPLLWVKKNLTEGGE